MSQHIQCPWHKEELHTQCPHCARVWLPELVKENKMLRKQIDALTKPKK